MAEKEVTAGVRVICECGQKHKLMGGIDAPIYWCGDELKILKAGDEIEYDEIDPVDDIARRLDEVFKPYKNIRLTNLLLGS